MKKISAFILLLLLATLAWASCPILMKVSAVSLTPTSGLVTFKIDSASTVHVEYGLTNTYGFSTDPTAYGDTLEHSQSITGLAPATLYHYRVRATNVAGTESLSGDNIFTTLSTGPTMSYITARSVTPNTAIITWKLSEAANGVVQYGLTTEYGSLSTSYDAFDKTSHSIQLTELTPSTLYHYRTKSINTLGEATVSDDHVFTTKPSDPPLVISNIVASDITSGGATISWDLSENATGQVEYGLTTYYGSTSTGHLTVDQSSHTEVLTNLASSTIYHYRVKSTNAEGAQTVSADQTFTTSAPAAGGPVISDVTASSITSTSAIISWNLSEVATGQVEYGATTAYGNTSALEGSLKFSAHSQSISGLTPGLLYHYRVRSTNAANDETISGDFTFTTVAAGPIISDVSATNITSTSALIGWALSEPATGQVEYGLTNTYGSLSALESSFDYTSHLQTLSNLSSGTLYHYRVKSTNAGGAESVSSDYTFTTTGSSSGYTKPTLVNVQNPMNHGALCNGSTNDFYAFQAAINAGDVLVPAGKVCVINGALNVTTSNKHIECGEGTVLRQTVLTGSMIVYQTPGSGRISGDSIVNCTFIGTGTVPATTDWNNSAKHWNIPILARDRVDNMLLAGNTFDRFFGQAMFQTVGTIDGGTGDQVVYNTFKNCGYYGVAFVAHTNGLIAHNTATDCAIGVENDNVQPPQNTGGNILEYNTLTCVYGYGAPDIGACTTLSGGATINGQDYSTNIVRNNAVSGTANAQGAHPGSPSYILIGSNVNWGGAIAAQYSNNTCTNGCSVIP